MLTNKHSAIETKIKLINQKKDFDIFIFMQSKIG